MNYTFPESIILNYRITRFSYVPTAYVSYMSLVHTAYICPLDNYPWIKTKQNETLSIKSV